MTDKTAFVNSVQRVAQNFNATLGEMKSIRDRIGAESSLSTAAATAAPAALGLSAADFDNFKVFVDLVESLLGKNTGQTVTVTQGTGGQLQLAFQRML